MLTNKPVAIMAAAATLLPPVLATFDASANTNMAVYWVSLATTKQYDDC